jgi:hypothetical protein
MPASTRCRAHALGAADQDHRVHAVLGQSYLGRALGIGNQVEIDYRPGGLEKATPSCWPPTRARARRPRFSGRCDPATPTTSMRRRPGGADEALRTRQPGQPHRAGGSRRRIARGAGQRTRNAPPRTDLPAACWSRAWCSRAFASCASCMPAAAATSTWRWTRDAAARRAQDTVDRPARRPRPSTASCWRNGWRAASTVRTCSRPGLRSGRAAPVRGDGICRGQHAVPMAGRPPASQPGHGARHRVAARPRIADAAPGRDGPPGPAASTT